VKKLATAFFSAALLTGIALTIWGLVHLSWPQALPWAGKSALFQYLTFMGFSAGLVVAGSLWSKRSPLVVGAVIAAGLALLSGAVWPLLVTLWFAFASAILGKSIFSTLRIDTEENWLTNFLVGAGVYGTVIGLLAHFPVNYPGVYGVALALPVVLRWRNALEYGRNFMDSFAKKGEVGFRINWLDTSVVVIALVYFVVALMPELGHDALAMHLFIPVHLALRHQWGFDAGTYVWAVMPLLGDWIFSIGYMLAGETASRLINVGFIFILGWLARDLVLWAGGSIFGARWATLIFLSTPLTFTEGSSLFIESVWAAFVVAATLVLLRLNTTSGQARSGIPIAGLLLGLAVATKAVTLSIIPVLALLLLCHYRAWFRVAGWAPWFAATGLFLSTGLIPYVTAWRLTGNPTFPFFNGIFHSPYYPAVNFDSSGVFGKGVTWDILYRATFESGKYLEAIAGASGFQWLLLLVPAAIVLIAMRHRNGLILLLVGSMIIVAVFHSVSYFRYAFPAWVILAAVMGIALGSVSSESRLVNGGWMVVATGAVILNLVFLVAGAQYSDFPLRSIRDEVRRDQYLQTKLPLRRAVALVNQLNTGRSPVGAFSEPMTAGLAADALYPIWYNFKFQGEINAASTAQAVANTLLQRGVDFVILDSYWSGGPEKRDLIGKATELIAEYGSISVRRVRTDYRFKTEMLKNPEFSSMDAWSLAPGAEYDAASKVITTSVAASATQAIAASPGQRYRNSVVARCYKEATLGRIQINWLDAKGQFVTTDIKTFDCTPGWTEQMMEVAAPAASAVGIVYVTGHTATPLQFKSNSLRQ
jgi:4-amino-4-deoxy-L-arabinose transferase-like glycosyltransferase